MWGVGWVQLGVGLGEGMIRWGWVEELDLVEDCYGSRVRGGWSRWCGW